MYIKQISILYKVDARNVATKIFFFSIITDLMYWFTYFVKYNAVRVPNATAVAIDNESRLSIKQLALSCQSKKYFEYVYKPLNTRVYLSSAKIC